MSRRILIIAIIFHTEDSPKREISRHRKCGGAPSSGNLPFCFFAAPLALTQAGDLSCSESGSAWLLAVPYGCIRQVGMKMDESPAAA